MMRFVLGALLLVIAAALLGAAGGLDVTAPAGWQNALQTWSMPPPADDKRLYLVLLSCIFGFLAVVRLLSSTPPRI